MKLLPIALVGGALVSVAVLARRPAAGKGATDVLPPGWTGPPQQTNRVKASSGREYDVMSWPVINGEDYFVAQIVGDPNTWVAYFHNIKTGKRRLFRAAASTPAVKDMLLSDFKVTNT
jgi:hypothetical protein